MENKKPSFHNYDRSLERLITRIKGIPVVYEGKKGKVQNARDLSILTEKNRQYLLDYHKLCVRSGNSVARTLARLERLTYCFVFFGNQNIDTATPKDFEEVANQIMTDKNLTLRTRKERLEQLKMFDKEFFGQGEACTDRTKKLKIAKSSKEIILPEEILTESEAYKTINATTNLRDRAFLSCLWSSGGRVGELGNALIKHFQPTGKGNEAYLILNGKTGMRRVLLVEGVLDIMDWLKTHPKSQDPNAPLFCMTCKGKEGFPLTHAVATHIVRGNMKRAKIVKRTNPHSWRHGRATHLCAKGLPEMQMRQYFGWSKTSDMPSVYAHLSQKNIDSSLRLALGLEEEKPKEVRCKICGTINEIDADSCQRCGNALSVEGSIKIQQQNKVLERFLSLERLLNEKVRKLQDKGYKSYEAEEIILDQYAREQVSVVEKTL